MATLAVSMSVVDLSQSNEAAPEQDDAAGDVVEAVLDEAERRAVIDWLGEPSFKARIWPWQYREHARKDGVPQQPSYVALRSRGGSLLGFNGFMPVRVRVGGRERPAAWSCDFVVAPEARNRGIGGRLKQLLRRRVPVLMALGISDAAAAVHRRAGWSRPDAEVLEVARGRHGAGVRAIARRTLQALRGHGAERLEPDEALHRVRLEPVTAEVASRLARLWRRTAADWPNAVVRDADYLIHRYASCPVAGYDALLLTNAQGEDRAALVVRAHPWETAIVDYVGPGREPAAKRTLAAAFDRRFGGARSLHCLTSDHELVSALARRGFLRRRGRPRFHVQSAEPARAELAGDWRLYAGDSDGEFLAAARLHPQVRVRVWSEDEVLAAEGAWEELLAQSDAHPLFMSWQWQQLWWRHVGRPCGWGLSVLAAHDRRDALVGLAAFAVAPARGRFGAAGRRLRLAPAAASSAGEVAAPAACRALVIRSGMEPGVVAGLAAGLDELEDWHELVLEDLDSSAASSPALARRLRGVGHGARRLGRRTTTRIDTSGSMAAFRDALAPSARRGFDARERCEHDHGPILLEQAVRGDDVESYFEELNALHAARSGSPAFEAEELDLHLALARLLAERGSLRLSRLRAAGETRSVMFGVRCGDEDAILYADLGASTESASCFARAHLAMAVEQAFREPTKGIELFSRGAAWAAELGRPGRELVTLRVARGRSMLAAPFARKGP